MEIYTVIDENTVEVGGDRFVFKITNGTGCQNCGLYQFSFDCIRDKRIMCLQKSLATVVKHRHASLERWGVFVKDTKLNNKIMEKERKITAPEGCEIEKVELIDGVAVVTFKKKERKLPKSWEEFCEMFPKKYVEYFINAFSDIVQDETEDMRSNRDKNLLPDRATAEAILALCQLIQLRNAYNGDWVPDWTDWNEKKYVIIFHKNNIAVESTSLVAFSPLYFKSEELRDEFLRNFRRLIEKLKPLYGIKEGGCDE